MSKKPVLYYTLLSPPCRAVLLAAAALDLELDKRDVDLRSGDHLKDEFLKMNSQHTIPVLDDNGVIITDSHVISGYLVDKYSKDDSLYPKDPVKRMLVDTRLYFDCGHLFPRLRFMVEPVFYYGCDEIPEEKVLYMQKAYDGLEKCLSSTPYVCGDHVTIADLCCVATVSVADLIAPVEPEKYPKAKAWLERMIKSPIYQKAGLETGSLKNRIKEKLAENKKAKQSVSS